MNLRPFLTLPPLVLALWAACDGDNGPPVFDIKEPDEDDTGAPPIVDSADSDVPAGDDTDPGESDTPPPPELDCDVPDAPGLAGVCDLSVNQADAIAPAAAGEPLLMRTMQSPPNPPGAFVSPAAVGNRAIAGFHGYTGLRVSAIERVEIDIEHISGPDVPPAAVAPEINFTVDLTCGFSDYVILNVTFENLGEAVDIGNNRVRYTVLGTEPKWSVVTGLYDEAGTTLIIPDADVARSQGLPLQELSDFVGAWPNACVRNVKSGDLAMPVDTVTSGFMLTMGRATTLIKSEWKVWRVQINDDVHGPP